LRRAGYKVIGAVENDPLACRAYTLNHPRTRLWKLDITSLSGKAVMKRLGLRPGDLDLLAACPPCQGFSSMRTKNGARRNRDPRNDLIFQVVRFARAMKPKALMVENVPGLQKSSKFRAFRLALMSLGYSVAAQVLNVGDYGVPQRRKRLVILATTNGAPPFARKHSRSPTVRRALEGLRPPSKSRDPLHNYLVRRKPAVLELIRDIPPNGGSRAALGRDRQLTCHAKFDGFRDVYGRMAWNKPAPTITSGCINPSKGRFLHPAANRAITLREAAILQSFPRSYRFPVNGGRYAIARLIGNAMPPEFIRRHALALKPVLAAECGTRKRSER
jgi:DNA (cytosine-5)-methyltransferase 1